MAEQPFELGLFGHSAPQCLVPEHFAYPLGATAAPPQHAGQVGAPGLRPGAEQLPAQLDNESRSLDLTSLPPATAAAERIGESYQHSRGTGLADARYGGGIRDELDRAGFGSRRPCLPPAHRRQCAALLLQQLSSRLA